MAESQPDEIDPANSPEPPAGAEKDNADPSHPGRPEGKEMLPGQEWPDDGDDYVPV